MAQIHILLRRDLASIWTSNNPTLKDGEIGLETDTRLIKIGDGITTWNNLTYFKGDLSNYYTSGEVDNQLLSCKSDITTLQGYFTNGIANKATLDKNGNDIAITYVKPDGSLTENQLIVASSNNKIKTGYAILDDLSTEGASGIPTSNAVKNAISTATSSIDMSSKLDKLPGYTGESTESERAYVVYPNGTQGYIAVRSGYSISGIPKYVQGKIQSGTAEKEYDVINLGYLNGAIENVKDWAKDYVAEYVSQYVEDTGSGGWKYNDYY